MLQITRRNSIAVDFSKQTIIIFICIIESVVLALFNKSKSYEFLFLLPIVYGLSYLIFIPFIKKKCNYVRGYPYYIAQIVIAYRYLILPLSCIYTDIHGGWTISGAKGFGTEPSPNMTISATLWMCTEVFFAELALYIGTCVTNRKETRRLQKEKTNCNSLCNLSFLKTKSTLVIFSVLAFLLLFLFQRHLFSQFLILDSNYDTGDNAASGSFYKLIFLALRFSLLMLGYSFCAQKYSKNKKAIWIIIAMLFLIAYIGYSIGVSRWNLILPVIASIEILREAFKPFPKSILIAVIAVIAIIAVIAVFSVSFFKYGYLIEGSTNPVWSMIVLIFQQSNEYVSGPRSVAQGLQTLDIYGNRISVSTFFNSIFSGFAGLASITNEADKLGSLFNLFCTGKLQNKPLICPILIEGLAFFPIFPWIFMMIFHILMCIMDYYSKTSRRYEMRFLATYMGLWFALCFALNTTIEMSQISQVIAVWLLFKVNTKFHFAKSLNQR